MIKQMVELTSTYSFKEYLPSYFGHAAKSFKKKVQE